MSVLLEVTTVNVLKFRTLYSIFFFPQILLFMPLFLKSFNGLTNSVDPDQSDVGLHFLHMPFC